MGVQRNRVQINPITVAGKPGVVQDARMARLMRHVT
jgi:hypothetical protein